MVYTADLKSVPLTRLWVRVPPRPPSLFMKFTTTNNCLSQETLDAWNTEAAEMALEFKKLTSAQQFVGGIALAGNTEVEYLAHLGVYW